MERSMSIRRSLASVLFVSLGINLIGCYQKEIQSEPGGSEKSEALAARNALEYWSEQRSYPDSIASDSLFYRSFLQSQSSSKTSPRPLTADSWTSLGPTNVGGRTLAVVVDPKNPSIVYAGSAGSGLWRMTQNGSSYKWERIETGFPVLGVNAIAISPTDSKVLYIGTGEVYGYQNSIGGRYKRLTRGSYGIGILKSVDSGVTWTKSLDWSYSQQRGVLCLRIDPTSPNIIFAGTSEGTYRSSDAGATWQQVHNVLMTVDLVLNPNTPNIIFASCGNLGTPGLGLYRSQDGGTTWQKLSGGLPTTWGGKTMLAIYKASPTTLYADIAQDSLTLGLFRSQDNGNTWAKINLDTNNWANYQGWYSHFVRVNPMDNSRLILGGVFLFTSTNGAASLQLVGQPHPDNHCYADDPLNANVVYVGNDGGIYKTTNGGTSWTEMSTGYVTSQFYNGFSSSALNPNLALGGLQDNSVVTYSGTTTWSSLENTIGGDGTMTGIHSQNDAIRYAELQRLIVYRSLDAGANWSRISQSIEDPAVSDPTVKAVGCFVSPFMGSPSSPSTLYGGNLYFNRSVDRGTSWTKMNGGKVLNGSPLLTIGISPQDANAVYVATAPTTTLRAQLFATTDGGLTFRNITGELPDRYYVDLVVSPKDSRIVYVTLSGFGSSHLFRSVDAGANWMDIGTGLPDVPTSAIAIDPANDQHLYVGNDLGVYFSLDNGKSWAEWKDNMPTAVMVMDLSLSLSNRKIRAVTHGNGVFERSMLSSTAVKFSSPHAHRLGLTTSREGIVFTLPEEASVTLELFDTKGERTMGKIQRVYAPGRHVLTWNEWVGVSEGIYLCRIQAKKEMKTSRIHFP